MSATSIVLPLLVFEAADCLMAVTACEIAHLEQSAKRLQEPFSNEGAENFRTRLGEPAFDLGEYFTGHESDGPWLHWARGACSAWLRVRSVVDVVPLSLSGLTPMPALLRGQHRTCAFLASGVRGDDVFLLLDPARLSAKDA
jgi:hypothetical protein